MMPRSVLFPLAPVLFSVFALAQGDLFAQRFKVVEVADIVPGPDSSGPSHFTRLGNELIFTARDATLRPVQRAIFKTDGHSVQRLGDVLYGFNESSFADAPFFAELNGELFFTAFGANGGELYKTDGEHVVEVADINPVSATSRPRGFARLGQELYFRAVGPNGAELYKTNGTDVFEVADLFPGSESSDPQALARLGQEMVFVAKGPNGREPYRTDGITTVQLADLNPGPADSFFSGLSLPVFHEIGGRLVFSAMGPSGEGFYSTDGTDVVELNVDPSPARDSFAKLGDHLLFAAVGPDGEELFKTDGRTVTQVADIFPGPDNGSSPGPFTELKGELYFSAQSPSSIERVLYKTDGNTVQLVADLGNDTSPGDLRAFKDELYFTAVGPAGFDLYKTDGTNVVALDVNPNGDAFFGRPGPPDLMHTFYAEFKGHLFFRAIGPNGWDTFSTDGSNLFHYDIEAFNFTEFNGELFFTGRGPNGLELYKFTVVPEPSAAVLVFMAALLGITGLRRRSGR
jgi:ELWxxDGT repeat protein